MEGFKKESLKHHACVKPGPLASRHRWLADRTGKRWKSRAKFWCVANLQGAKWHWGQRWGHAGGQEVKMVLTWITSRGSKGIKGTINTQLPKNHQSYKNVSVKSCHGRRLESKATKQYWWRGQWVHNSTFSWLRCLRIQKWMFNNNSNSVRVSKCFWLFLNQSISLQMQRIGSKQLQIRNVKILQRMKNKTHVKSSGGLWCFSIKLFSETVAKWE